MVKFSQLKVLSWGKSLEKYRLHLSGHCRTWTPVEHPTLSQQYNNIFLFPLCYLKHSHYSHNHMRCQGNVAGCFKGFTNNRTVCFLPSLDNSMSTGQMRGDFIVQTTFLTSSRFIPDFPFTPFSILLISFLIFLFGLSVSSVLLSLGLPCPLNLLPFCCNLTRPTMPLLHQLSQIRS